MTAAIQRGCCAQKALGGRAYLRMADGMPTVGTRLRTAAGSVENPYPSRYDPYYGRAIGMIFDPVKLFKPPLIKLIRIYISPPQKIMGFLNLKGKIFKF